MAKVDEVYLFHTHLGIWLGRIVDITVDDFVLNQCSWVASQGRMGACVRTGSIEESEYVGDGVEVPRTAIKVPWRHTLPTHDLPVE